MSRRLLDQACRAAGFEPAVDRVTGSPFTLLALALQGGGVAIMSDDVPPPGLARWPRIEAGGRSIAQGVDLYWRPVEQPPAVAAFIELARRLTHPIYDAGT